MSTESHTATRQQALTVDPAARRVETELVDLSEMASRLAMKPRTFRELVRREQLPRVVINARVTRYEPERVIAVIVERFAR